jgi:hypothetical protein
MANLPTYYYQDERSGEVTGADWTGGMNPGGSNAPGIGIATDVVNPKAQDWARIADVAAHESQAIGLTAGALNVVQGADINDTLAFVTAIGAVAPGAEIDVTTGAVNRSSTTLQAGDWLWGAIPVV